MTGNDFSDRRRFLAGTLRRAAAAAAFWLYGMPGAADSGKPLAPAQRAALDAVLDTLIPDDEFPGAVRTGVPERLEDLLAGGARRARVYRRGLEAIDRAARDAASRSFTELPLEERGRLLEQFETGFGPGSIFFHYVRRDAMTVFYSSPEAYAMLGYVPPVNGYPYTAVPPGGPDDAGG